MNQKLTHVLPSGGSDNQRCLQVSRSVCSTGSWHQLCNDLCASRVLATIAHFHPLWCRARHAVFTGERLERAALVGAIYCNFAGSGAERTHAPLQTSWPKSSGGGREHPQRGHLPGCAANLTRKPVSQHGRAQSGLQAKIPAPTRPPISPTRDGTESRFDRSHPMSYTHDPISPLGGYYTGFWADIPVRRTRDS
jgi:hypothetical protein